MLDVTDRYANRQIGTARFVAGYYGRLATLLVLSTFIRRSPTV
jgi:hypothetical protein